jgi:hypothetical protein
MVLIVAKPLRRFGLIGPELNFRQGAVMIDIDIVLASAREHIARQLKDVRTADFRRLAALRRHHTSPMIEANSRRTSAWVSASSASAADRSGTAAALATSLRSSWGALSGTNVSDTHSRSS